jgi:putative FmdB family regulatory protein
MPIYAYKCDSCGHAHDALQKISDAPLRDCPACGKAALVKQVTAAGFQLKGSGWYVTDFRNGSGSAASAPAVSTAAGGAGSDAGAAASAAPASTSSTTTAPAAAS